MNRCQVIISFNLPDIFRTSQIKAACRDVGSSCLSFMQLLFIHPKISTHPTGKGKCLKAERKQMTQAAAFRWGFHTLHKLLLLCQSHMSQHQEARAASAPVLRLCYGTGWLLKETSHRDWLGVFVPGSSHVSRPAPTSSTGVGLWESHHVCTPLQELSFPRTLQSM